MEYDIVVIGGGPAGVVASIAAAREGKSVLLVEQNGYLGGMLTMAGVGPQMTYHAGETQVIKGIGEEIVQRLMSLGFSPGHMEDFVGFASSVTPFDVEGMKLVLESMAREAGVKLLYHTVYTGCEVRDKKIACVHLYSKNGFFDVTAKVFIDASADADLATHAGVTSVYGRESDNLAQPMTMNVKVGNVDRDKMISYVKSHRDDMLSTIPFDRLELLPRAGIQGARSVIIKAKANGEFNVDRDVVLCFETNTKGELILNMTRVIKKSAVDPFDLTDAEIEGRRQAHEVVAFMKKYIPGFEDCRILTTGPHIGIRESRKIDGVYKLTGNDLVENKMFADAIAMGGYPIDIHSPDGATMKYCSLKPGSWYSIPYRCLVTEKIDNLIVAGRCISATHEACAAIRVSPIIMATAHAAGLAAAQSVTTEQNTNAIDTDVLRKTLVARGAFLEEYKGAR